MTNENRLAPSAEKKAVWSAEMPLAFLQRGVRLATGRRPEADCTEANIRISSCCCCSGGHRSYPVGDIIGGCRYAKRLQKRGCITQPLGLPVLFNAVEINLSLDTLTHGFCPDVDTCL